ncbi:hypothetical protein ACFWDG_06890 [Peribacillus sp. NPDC060186]
MMIEEFIMTDEILEKVKDDSYKVFITSKDERTNEIKEEGLPY